MKLFEIREKPQQKSKVKTATDGPDLSAFRKSFRDNLAGDKNLPTSGTKQSSPTTTPNKKMASAQKTRSSMRNVEMPDGASDKLDAIADLDMEDEISDAEAAQRAGHGDMIDDEGYVPEPTEPETLPAVINQQLAVAGSDMEPEWHQVKNLPGYLQSPIRAMGRAVFEPFTKTPIEDIQVLANLGSGPNDLNELKMVATWLERDGVRDTDGEMKFQRAIPDYEVDYRMYRAAGATFMVVKDFAGHYIYSWPASDNKYLSNDEQPAKLGHDAPRLR